MLLVPALLSIAANGYDFELDMLRTARDRDVPQRETTIHTVYLAGNASSHFNPLLDSMRIYFVLFRCALSSLPTALLDLAIFSLRLHLGATIPLSQLGARLVAIFFNYNVVKRRIFTNRNGNGPISIKYLLLEIVSGTVSLLLIHSLMTYLHVRVFIAKILAESVIFIANFAI